MATPYIVPLLLINLPSKRILCSTIDIGGINSTLFRPLIYYNDTNDLQFEPLLLDSPSVDLSVDIYDINLSFVTIQINMINKYRLQDYECQYPLESIGCVFIKYDLNNDDVLFKLVGKMSRIEIDNGTLSFSLQDHSASFFGNIPERVLKEDTFQTIHTIGPFSENPLSLFGLLVDLDPGPNKTVDLIGWPAWAPGQDDRPRALCTFIQHPSLYNDDDLYWVGSLVSIIQDPIGTDEFIERSGYVPGGGAIDPTSPYQNFITGWPTSAFDPGAPLISKYCLGASAYVVRNTSVVGMYLNAKYTGGVSPRVGRIWFDTKGPELADWTVIDDITRRLPNSNDPESGVAPGLPAYQRWAYRSDGAKIMGDIAQRHVIRIWRRCIPEGVNAVGKPFPIIYGHNKKIGPVIHAIGGKAISMEAGAGNDYYIICEHPIASRLRTNGLTVAGTSRIDDVIQFAEIKIWHSLDEFTAEADKKANPYIYNPNEFMRSNNPIPRIGNQVFDWATSSYLANAELDPCLMWFICGEDNRYRYPYIDDTKNRQITLTDNYNNPKVSRNYTGFRLRGDEYWEKVSGYVVPLINTLAEDNYYDPRYWMKDGLGPSNLYVDCNGWPDFDDGWLTCLPASGVVTSNYDATVQYGEKKNTAGCITNPVDIIAHLLLKYTKIHGDRTLIDWPSFRKTKGQLFNWQFVAFINEIQSIKGDIIPALLSQCRCALFVRENKFYIRFLDLNPSGNISYMFKNNVIIKNSFKSSKEGSGQLYNKFVIKFKRYYPFSDSWENSITYDTKNNKACAIAEARYNASDSFEFLCPNVNDWKVAKFLADYFVTLYTKPRFPLEFETYINDDIKSLQPGDKVMVQHPELSNYANVLRTEPIIVDPKFTFLVLKVAPGDVSYKFSLLQL